MRPKVVIVSCAAGGAHDSAARRLKLAFEREFWDVEVLDAYRDILQGLDPFESATRRSAVEIYNRLVQQRGWSVLFWLSFVLVGRLLIGLRSERGIALAIATFAQAKPDAVISVVPLLNRVLCEAACRYSPRVPYMTWVLDLKECARGVWIAHRSQSIACFTDEVADQAKRFGIPPGRVHLVAAPLELARDQRATTNVASCVTKHQRPAPPIVVVVFGASGADRMLDYAMELQKLSAVSLIYVCGRHLNLKARLEARVGASATVLGFVADMQELYAQASVVVSKPGAMTIWEALGNSVPLVLELNWSTPVQERYQARWAERHGLAVTFRSPRVLCRAVRAALNRTPSRFHEAKTQIGWREGEDCCTALVQWVQRAGGSFQ